MFESGLSKKAKDVRSLDHDTADARNIRLGTSCFGMCLPWSAMLDSFSWRVNEGNLHGKKDVSDGQSMPIDASAVSQMIFLIMKSRLVGSNNI